MIHVAVIHAPQVAPIMDGRKTVELRLSLQRQPWHGLVRAGERVYFKHRGGPIFATALIRLVRHHVFTTREDLREFRRSYAHAACEPTEFWNQRRASRHGVAVFFTGVEPVFHGPALIPGISSSQQAAWHALPDHEDVYPLCSVGVEADAAVFVDPLLEASTTSG